MKRVLIVIKHDGIGGMERGTSNLLDALEHKGVTCDIVALSPPSSEPGLLADRSVAVLRSRARGGPLRRLSQLRQIRALVRNSTYDAVIAFGPSPNAIVSLLPSRGPVKVIVEVGNPFIPRRRLWNAAMMWTYRRADALVVYTEELAGLLRAQGIGPPRTLVIPSVLGPGVTLAPPSPSRSPTIISVGRLVPSKRVGDLVTAFSRVSSRFPEWRLTIVGDGDTRAALEHQVQDLGLADRVVFTGFVSNPWRIMANASIFVLTSAHEGFARVLVEALASGCAIVSTDCQFGPKDVLGNGQRGRLYPVGDISRLCAHLEELMGNVQARHALAESAHSTVGAFQTSDVAERWLTLVSELRDRPR